MDATCDVAPKGLYKEPISLGTGDGSTRFATRCHPNADAVCAEVDAFFAERWPWPSDAARDSFLKTDSARWACWTFPDAKNERIVDIAKVTALLFLIDDLWETLPPTESKAMLKRFMPVVEGKLQPVVTNPYEQILYDTYAKMRAVNDALVEAVSRGMAIWANTQVDQERKHCKGMGALLQLRHKDSAAGWVTALMAYAMDLYLLPSERASIVHIEKAYAYLAIIDNEIESYDKEVAASGRNGVVNLVQMQADDTGCSIAASKRILWVLYRELQLEFLELVAKREASAEGCSETLKSYMKGLECVMGGNEVWSGYSERYHPAG